MSKLLNSITVGDHSYFAVSVAIGSCDLCEGRDNATLCDALMEHSLCGAHWSNGLNGQTINWLKREPVVALDANQGEDFIFDAGDGYGYRFNTRWGHSARDSLRIDLLYVGGAMDDDVFDYHILPLGDELGNSHNLADIALQLLEWAWRRIDEVKRGETDHSFIIDGASEAAWHVNNLDLTL